MTMNEQVAKRVLAKIQGFLNKKHSWGRFILRWQPGVHSVLPLGGHSEGNRYTLYTTGDDAFAAKWESIKKVGSKLCPFSSNLQDFLTLLIVQAKEKVWCSVYTIEPDRVGQHTVDLLVQAKKRGCRVILLYDYIGSHRISHNFLEPLYSVGAGAFPHILYSLQAAQKHSDFLLHIRHWSSGALSYSFLNQNVFSSARYMSHGMRAGEMESFAVTKSC